MGSGLSAEAIENQFDHAPRFLGSERPVHEVRIKHRLAVGIHEVTRAQFASFVRATGYEVPGGCRDLADGDWRLVDGISWRDPGFEQTGQHPVVCIRKADARAYLDWLSEKTGETYRLPTEGEWEHIARAGTQRRYWFGDRAGEGCDAMNAGDRTLARQRAVDARVECADGHAATAPVGTFAANAFGLHDVHGNVWEAVRDCWHPNYDGAPRDGRTWLRGGDADCSRVVIRGGSWFSGPGSLRSSARAHVRQDARATTAGFRVVREVSSPEVGTSAEDDGATENTEGTTSTSETATLPIKVDGKTLSAGDTFRDCASERVVRADDAPSNAVCGPEMVVIPPGEFKMGSSKSPSRIADKYGGKADYFRDEGPVHTVNIRAPFAVATTEVSREQFARFVESSGYEPDDACYTFQDGRWAKDPKADWEYPTLSQGSDEPVTCISWKTAQAFADWLSDETGADYRLLTEAEWEYVARAGRQTAFWFGDDTDDACEAMNIGDGTYVRDVGASHVNWETLSCYDGHTSTAPVGSLKANPFGVHNIHGNVEEWVQDCFHDNYVGAPSDGRAWLADDGGSCSERVARGGAWSNVPGAARSADRYGVSTNQARIGVGIRVARDLAK